MSEARVDRAAVVGGGVIGGGWAARLVLSGIDVAFFDPSPAARESMAATLARARRVCERLFDCALPREGALRFCEDSRAAVADADWIFESAPEDIEAKRAVYRQIEEAARADAIVSSSTSGLLPSRLQEGMKNPARFLVAHPFNPVYLLPLVELVGGGQTAPATVARARDFLASIDMAPLVVRKEIDAFVADRLLEAMWRESLWLVKDGVATTGEIDDAIRFGFGLRFAQMGIFQTYRAGGGRGGMRHFLAQFGPSLKWPWTKLVDVPELDDGLIETVAAQSDAQNPSLSVADLESARDDNLVAILRALKNRDWGAGAFARAREKSLAQTAAARKDVAAPRAFARKIPPEWCDYNAHLNESRYLECFSRAADFVLESLGVNAAYVASGGSFFTVENRILHLREARAGESVFVTSRVAGFENKTLRLAHELWREGEGDDDGGDGALAVGEQTLVHVDLQSRRSSPPAPSIAAAARAACARDADLPPIEALARRR